MFTRFIPPWRAEEMGGAWRSYFERWREVTRERLDPKLLGLTPPLSSFSPPATVIDKSVYSAFADRRLHDHLRARGTDALILSGAETDMCVLSTALGVIDYGYRVVIATDAVCSSSDKATTRECLRLQLRSLRPRVQHDGSAAQKGLSRLERGANVFCGRSFPWLRNPTIWSYHGTV